MGTLMNGPHATLRHMHNKGLLEHQLCLVCLVWSY